MAQGIFARDNGGGDFEIPEAGSYIARCYKIIDIGTQEVAYLGKTSFKRKVLMWFELLEDEDGDTVTMSSGEPFTVLQRYTLSTNSQATLRHHIDAWRGKALTAEEAKEFDVTKLLGQSCRLQVTLDEKDERTYVNIASIGHTKKEPKGVNKLFWWTIEDPDLTEFENFPEWLQNKIASAEEWSSAAKKAATPKKKDVVPEDVEDNVDLSSIPERGDDLDVSEVKF